MLSTIGSQSQLGGCALHNTTTTTDIKNTANIIVSPEQGQLM